MKSCVSAPRAAITKKTLLQGATCFLLVKYHDLTLVTVDMFLPIPEKHTDMNQNYMHY